MYIIHGFSHIEALLWRQLRLSSYYTHIVHFIIYFILFWSFHVFFSTNTLTTTPLIGFERTKLDRKFQFKTAFCKTGGFLLTKILFY